MFMNKSSNVALAREFIAPILLLLFCVLSILSVLGKTVTVDEGSHFRYGISILQGDSTRFDDSKMPISALNALPRQMSSWISEGGFHDLLNNFMVARAMTIIFSALVGWLVFYWSRSLYGFVPGLFSLLLYILDPNIIAHSQLVTTDIYAAGTIAFALYGLWRFAHRRDWPNGLLCVFALGLSQIAKYTAIALLPLFFLILFIYDLPTLARSSWPAIRTFLLSYVIYGVVALFGVILIINLGFLFNRTLTPFGEYKFRSQLFHSLQSDYPVLRAIPVPVPYPYLEGLDWVIQRERSGQGSGNIYLLGQVKNQGFIGYYFIASLLKTPIATQIIIGLSIASILIRKSNRRQNFLEASFLLIPVAFFVIYFNFFYNTQIGIRFYLIIFPLLFVFAGSLFQRWESFTKLQKVSAAVLIGYLAVSVFSYFPNYLPYFNEIVWDRKSAYKYLADSNLDWGQSKRDLKQYMSAYPDAIYSPERIVAGRIIVPVNFLVGVARSPKKHAWLREHFEPVETIAGAYLVYQVSPEEIESLCNSTDACK